MTLQRDQALKIGLLGIDAGIAAVVAAARRAGDTIVLACDVSDDSAWREIIDAAPRAPVTDELLDGRRCDVVFVGADGWNDRRADCLNCL